LSTRLGSLVLAFGAGLLILFVLRFTPFTAGYSLGIDALAPANGLIAGPWGSFQDLARTVQAAGELKAENDRLRAEVDRLTQAVVRLPELERENAELRAQLALKQSQPGYVWKQAAVIGREPSSVMRGLIINLGTSDGVQVGMAVISSNGSLVGRVVRAGASASQVLLITDVSSSVSALVQSTRAHGVVNGQRSGSMLMNYIRQGETLKTGDKVITSGEGGTFPQGLLIGEVTDVRQIDIEMFQEAKVDPLVDLDRLENVLVITNFRPPRLD